MPCDGQRSKGPQVPTVFQCQQAEGYDHQKNGLFVDMPSKEERSEAAQSHSSDEGLPRGLEEELNQT